MAGRDQREVLARRFGERNRSVDFERRTRNMCPGTQVSVPECVMQKRFPTAGESHICNTLRVRGLGVREKRDGAADDMSRFWVAVLGYHSTAVLVNDFRQLQVGSSREARPMGFLDYRLLLSGEDNIVMRTRDLTRKRAPGCNFKHLWVRGFSVSCWYCARYEISLCPRVSI